MASFNIDAELRPLFVSFCTVKQPCPTRTVGPAQDDHRRSSRTGGRLEKAIHTGNEKKCNHRKRGKKL